MEKRVLLAVVLSFTVLAVYQIVFPPTKPPAFQNPSKPAAATGQAPAVSPTATPAGSDRQASVATPVERPRATVAAENEQDVAVETPTVTALFSTRGGTLKSWRLKNYRDSAGQPLELVPTAVANAVRPFSLSTDDPGVSAVLRDALFKSSATSLDVGAGPSTLSFEYRDDSGLVATKQFSFAPERPYEVAFTAMVTRAGAPVKVTIDHGPGLGSGVIGGGMTYNPAPQPVFYRDGSATRIKIGDLTDRRVEQGTFKFAGVDDHYFLAAAVDAASARVEYRPIHVAVEGSSKGLQFIDWSIQLPDTAKDSRFFFGPKDFDQLRAISPELTYAIDFGMFRWLVVPLRNALKWVHGYLGNYGWSIIALTILINVAMFPLRHKSVVSMRRMQEIQPEVKAIQDRYAKLKMSDPARQKMNVELMNLYRERGVNPASGCVPMLLTFPVLFAFYAMLSVAIEIRGAPFVGWIHDLASNDPLFIWPVVMGITMLIQQKMTPTAMTDPMQARMMMLMPVVFSVMLAWAPSGLVLYWTASNLWTIGQQTLTNKLIGPPPQHNVRPPAERQLKNAGSGKSSQAKERK
jgi:YidC/Oxa1 family membrane protein insertase